MGAEIGKPISNLGITSMASVTPAIELKELSTLKTELSKVSSAKGTEQITKIDLDDGLKKSGKFDAADLDLFAKLFTLFDGGDETVNFKDYLSGVGSCLMSIPASEKLKYAFSLFDDGSGNILKTDLKRVLIAVNAVASYFGDPVLSGADLEVTTNDAHQTLTGGKSKLIPAQALIETLLEHDLVKVFMLGEGKVRFGSPELVTA